MDNLIMSYFNNSKLGLAVALMLILQYALIVGYAVMSGYKNKPKAFFLNLIPFWWAFMLGKAVVEAFYETVILNKK